MARAKRRQPYDPNRVHDRRTTDLLRNARVAPLEVDDPFELGAKIIVMRSTRNDPLANLHARHSIDEAQYRGGRAFQHDFETAERGPRAIDPSKEAVDGGRMPEPITDQQREAVVRLAAADNALGQNGAAVSRSILIHGMSIEQLGVFRGTTSETELKYLGRRFRECLDCLAEVYGFAMRER